MLSRSREHALAWAVLRNPKCDKLIVAPGNAGTAVDAENVDIAVDDFEGLIEFAKKNDVGLTVVGPEAPLVDGLADTLRDAGVAVFGPSAQAAQLEGSKAFTKALCDRAGIPTAAYVRCTTLAEALSALATFAPPFVLKADGLAGGKGVVIADNEDHAKEALEDMFGGAFGEARGGESGYGAGV